MRAVNALPPVIEEHMDELRGLCEKYHVRRLTLFGSAVKGGFDPERSDLDFVVEFFPHPDPLVEGRWYLDLWRELKDLFGRNIDLLTPETIGNPYIADSIRDAHRDLYAAA
jgi:predicted nucleotidyltransferase